VKDKNHTVWDYEIMRSLYKLDEFIRKEYDAGFLVSPPSMVKTIYQNSVQNAEDFPAQIDYMPISRQLMSHHKNREIRKVVSTDGMQARFSAKIRDIGSMKVAEHNMHLHAFINSNLDTTALKFELTGAAHLIDRNNEYMVSNMVQGFIFSIIVIGLLTFFLHRSWRMVLVFIIPNVLPVIIIGGIMGYLGIELKAATSLVFSIAFGIATDDTIHFISRLKIELGYGKSLLYAFKRTYFETGKPIILTTFILMGGFISLMTSNFESIFYFGFLICITVIIAVMADIFLLPVLLFLIYRKKK
jgi:predicted RND superfamily exporter protein